MKKGIITRIARSRGARRFAMAMALVMFFELGLPSVSLALTSGPGQPEYSSFEPASTTDMVNLYDGSFTYNIPLLTVPGPNGGYPINLAYHGNPGMEEEAGWVGLGWSLNVGAINRQLQGIPDDFNGTDSGGDQVHYDYHMKKNFGFTVGTSFGGPAHSEILGFPVTPPSEGATSSFQTQIYFNNYKGLGYRVSTNLVNQRLIGKEGSCFQGFFGLGLTLDSQNGIGIAPDISMGGALKGTLTAHFNSRTGLNNISFAPSYSPVKMMNKIADVYRKQAQNDKSISGNIDKARAAYGKVYQAEALGTVKASAGLTYQFGGQVPAVGLQTNSTQWSFDLRLLGTAAEFRSNSTPSTSTPVVSAFQAYPLLHHGNPYGFPSNWYMDFSTTDLTATSEDRGAVGFLYHNFSNSQVQDFTKQQLAFNKKMPNLGASKQTYDLFTFSGQGTGGFFRGYSNSIDLLAEQSKESTTRNNHVTAEVGVATAGSPPPTHIGGGYEHSDGTNTSGGWQTGAANFNSLAAGRNEAKQKIFRLHGETSPVLYNDEELDDWQGDDAVKNKLTDNGAYFGKEYQATTNYAVNDAAGTFGLNSDLVEKRKQRDKRNTSVKYIDYATAKNFGYSKDESYLNEDPVTHVVTSRNKFDDTHNPNHISEVVVTQTDGVRYVYGMPVYNKVQEEYSQSCNTTFNANNPYGTFTAGSYGPNHQYNEEMKNKTTYDPYAYSWLLSGIMGTDYIDDDGVEGISKNDKGYWVKFSYRRVHNAYKWRVPYKNASIIERRYGREEDNTASFTYGEKEIFYLDKVETATHVAVFEMGCRRDGIGAETEFATTAGDQQQKYLKKITLYTRPDYEANIADLSNAVPVMTANFRYDYELCKNTPNYHDYNCDDDDIVSDSNPDGNIIDGVGGDDDSGKLTLKEVYFTNERSTKAALSPYKFYYVPEGTSITDQAYNPNYDVNHLDRWGNYKNNGSGDYGSFYEFGRFPYSEQKTDATGVLADADMLVGKWSLHRILLPTGGTVNITYEPHDYAYEESKRPMHMYDIVGIGNNIGASRQIEQIQETFAANAWWKTSGTDPVSETPSAAPDRFYTGSTEVLTGLDQVNSANNGFRLFFRLEKPYEATLTAAECNGIIKSEYVGTLDRLWFKNKTLMSGSGLACNNKFEYVEGYSKIATGRINDSDAFGMCREVGASSSAPYTIGYITLDRVPLRENSGGIVKGNEMQKLALQVLKLERDDVGNCSFVGPTSGTGTLGEILGFLSSTLEFINELDAMLLSYNVAKYNHGYCRYIALNGNSKIKLYDEDQRKYGGGYRVKEVRLSDNWRNDEGSGTNNAKSEYGQKYVYTMNGKSGGSSSGVCYEPFMGREESSLRTPVEYEKSTFLSYHEEMFVEKPIMEAYYPGASIGYRKVTTYSLSRDVASEQITATSSTGDVNYSASAPVTVTEFYTPKEFPILVDETNINVEAPFIVPINIPGIYSYMEAEKAASQGYSIVLNDMAGKLKRTSQYRWLPPSGSGDIGGLGNVISTTEYQYKTAGTYNEEGTNALDNTVQLAINSGQYQTGKMGVYYDMFVEHHENAYEESGLGIQANLELLPFPPLFTFFPSGTENHLSEKTVVTHKVIYRSGIINKVVAKTDQSVLTTENLLYDSETGSVVLSRMNNQFDDPVYTLQQPAHWYYGNTGPMYRNDYLTLSGSYSMDANGWVTLSASSDEDGYDNAANFAEGDQVIVTIGTTQTLLTVAAIDLSAHAINLMDENGEPLGASTISAIYMLQSGRKNLLGLNVGAVSALGCNISDFTTVQTSPVSFSLSNFLDASAITLSDDWQMDCCSAHIDQEKDGFNPFLTGSRNMWRVKSSYGYNTERVYNNNSRTDGVFKTFAMFDWANPDGNPDWVKAGQAISYSPYGFEAETEDALGNFSSARYGYGNILPVAIASNSHYADMDFEGFEYVNPTNCMVDRELFGGSYSGWLMAGKSHSGKYGMWVQGTPFEFDLNVYSDYGCNSPSHHFTGGNFGEVVFNKDSCDCFGSSYLVAGVTGKPKKYIFSAWAKETGWAQKPTSFAAPKIDVTVTVSGTPTTTTYSLLSSDKIVEGWQRFFFTIEVPVGATAVSIQLKNTNSLNRDVYYDDLRIHPIESNMMSYVYDAVNFKLRAELDANNFATFYSYDEEGNLINTKKETTRGVKTITEGRKELQKRNM